MFFYVLLFCALLSDLSFHFCSVPRLGTVIQLLANMETCQLNPLSQAHLPREVHTLYVQHTV